MRDFLFLKSLHKYQPITLKDGLSNPIRVELDNPLIYIRLESQPQGDA